MNINEIQHKVINAKQLHIIGSNNQQHTKDDSVLDISDYSGVIEYFPEELVMTVKAGTAITEINSMLAKHGQALPFPVLNEETATIGSAYAVGNPELRDAVLGIKIIDGQGRILIFGGQVMKNVAGYDVARLLVGSKGKLAAICEIGFKVLPHAYINLSEKKTIINTEKTSATIATLEHGLKIIFDPRSVFI